MPLSQSGFVSRHALDHPEENPAKTEPLPYERVLKYNPNHDKATGRFASAGGGRKGGTVGAPTEDAFGNPLKPRRTISGGTPPIHPKTTGAMTEASNNAAYRSTQRSFDSGFLRGGPATRDPRFEHGTAVTPDPYFNRGASGKAHPRPPTPQPHQSGKHMGEAGGGIVWNVKLPPWMKKR